MSTLVIYYSFGGACKKEAERIARETGADVIRVKEVEKRSVANSLARGCPDAIRRRASALQPVDADLSQYDHFIVGAPIWAGHPAPAFNAIVNLLPAGAEIECFFCSAGGSMQKSEAQTRQLLQERGFKLTGVRNIRTLVGIRKDSSLD